jgi:hypothetical protein
VTAAPIALGVLVAGVSAAACGRIESEVGAELTPEAAPPPDAGPAETGVADTGEAGADSADAAPDANPCSGDLSNIGTADFRVSLTVTTHQTGLVAVVNQRTWCSPSLFWDIRIDGGFVYVEADDITSYGAIQSRGPRVDDGRPHDVLFQRKSHVLSVSVDDAGGTPTTPSTASFGRLPIVLVGEDVCIPQDGTVALVGKVSNICIASP